MSKTSGIRATALKTAVLGVVLLISNQAGAAVLPSFANGGFEAVVVMGCASSPWGDDDHIHREAGGTGRGLGYPHKIGQLLFGHDLFNRSYGNNFKCFHLQRHKFLHNRGVHLPSIASKPLPSRGQGKIKLFPERHGFKKLSGIGFGECLPLPAAVHS